MNIGGICLITDYSKVLELNLRKYQQLHSSANESSHGKGMEEKGLHVDKDDVHNEGS